MFQSLFRLVNKLTYEVEWRYDKLRWRIRRFFGVGPVQILPYIGYGTETHLYLQGRAVSDRRVRSALATDSMLKNFINTVRRFHTHELPNVRLRVQAGGNSLTTRTNREGRFHVALPLEKPLPGDTVWREVQLELVDYLDQPGARAAAEVIFPPPNARFAVISDLDDTVIQTNILNIFKAAHNTFLRNAHTRLSFPGVAAFYHALQKGTGDEFNPLFYVSTMPENLFDLIRDFFIIREIPLGPMFMTNLGLTETHFVRRSSRDHKLEKICRLIELYEHLPFVLIGDSGEEDPYIYLETLRRFPGRVRVIYIRDVRKGGRDEAIWALASEAQALGVDLLLVRDTLAAAEHAATIGLVKPDAINAIRKELISVAEHDEGSVATDSPL